MKQAQNHDGLKPKTLKGSSIVCVLRFFLQKTFKSLYNSCELSPI